MSEFFRKPIVKTLMLKGKDAVSISNIEKKSTSGLTDTYEITLTDGSKRTFNVNNGKGIRSIAKTSTSGLVDTYTTTYNDDTTSTFTVKNGEKGDTGSVENLKIGGVNLLDESSLTKAPSDKSNFNIGKLNTVNYNFENGYLTALTDTSDSKNNGVYLYVKNANDIIKPNEKATFSIDLKGENITFTFAIIFTGEKNHLYDNVTVYDIKVDEDKIDDFKRYSFSFVMPNVGTKDKGLGIVLRQGNKKDNCKIIYRNAKLERGETPTDWTPSLEDVENEIASAKDILNKTYPIGSIYMSVNSTSPAYLFGGTWEQIKDRFLLGASETYSSGSTGGEETHTLTVDEIPVHNHDTNDWTMVVNSRGANITPNIGASTVKGEPTAIVPNIDATKNVDGNATGTAGGGQAHNNMPPYLAVYMWKRIA